MSLVINLSARPEGGLRALPGRVIDESNSGNDSLRAIAEWTIEKYFRDSDKREILSRYFVQPRAEFISGTGSTTH